MQNALIQQLITLWLLGITTFLGGLMVRNWKVRVNYTRKIFHFVIFGVPFLLEPYLPSDRSLPSVLIIGACQLFCLISVLEPVRKRIWLLDVCFSAVDRPEDQPHTIYWLSTQVIATFAVTILVGFWLNAVNRRFLMIIPILVTFIGDGLAEPIGVRFGKRKYKTRGFFTDKVYERTLEGSSCVFVSAIVILLLHRSGFSGSEFWFLMAVLPVAMTLAEAWSPHTWDAPAMYLVGGSCIALAAIFCG